MFVDTIIINIDFCLVVNRCLHHTFINCAIGLIPIYNNLFLALVHFRSEFIVFNSSIILLGGFMYLGHVRGSISYLRLSLCNTHSTSRSGN